MPRKARIDAPGALQHILNQFGVAPMGLILFYLPKADQ
ncbi:hypothetical protein D1AOALGA4SA_3365 [Olavius algarvensis Delta 1 endosymbiont]|nr:hypothetical protein D1AOALGA4SA_3365 [Olavius algarvensis Delta 1 endosymbiont]